MKYTSWAIAVLLIAVLPAVTFAEHRGGRGNWGRGGGWGYRGDWGHRGGWGYRGHGDWDRHRWHDDDDNWGFSLGFGLGDSFLGLGYGDRVYSGSYYYAPAYVPPPAVVYPAPSYYPPPAVVYPAPHYYYYDTCPTPNYYGSVRYYYRR